MASFPFILICLCTMAQSRVLYPHETINLQRPSQLWVTPYLSIEDRKSHPFFARFDALHGETAGLLSNCTQHYITQYLDHFNYRAASNEQTTYKMRYFVCGGSEWKPNNTIFFYTGNEANVELYVNATGLMWENADAYNAIMVFAEHRYFGESQPFGSDEADLKNENLIYLSSDQAIADYAVLIYTLKKQWNSWQSAVIGFGGSYGGMLCAWFRIKYPQWIDACISASAPITSFMGEIPAVNSNFFADGETYDCMKIGGNKNNYCADNLQHGWNVIFNKANTATGRRDLYDAFQLCTVPQTVEDAANIANWIAAAISFMTMGSYPYSSSYMLNGFGVLPSYPMRVACGYLTDEIIKDDMELLQRMRRATGVFYNYTKNVECFDTNANANNATQIVGILWNYLYCTQIFQPFGQSGNRSKPYDMFWFAPWNATETALGCFQDYGIETRQLWAQENYGGWLAVEMSSLSNIVFSSGELDPWREASVQKVNDTERNIHSIIIPDAGHHIDLFFSNVNDTNHVRDARQFELDQITKWIKNRE